MLVRRVLLVDPCRFTRSSLSHLLQRHGLVVDARDRVPDGPPDSRLAGMLVVGPVASVGAAVTFHRVGREPVVLDRASLSLNHLLNILVRDEDPLAELPVDRAEPAPRLTPREREVLSEVARGASSRVIGERLGIHAKTVERHKAHVYEKLNVQNQAQAVASALRSGLVDVELHGW
jgi:DNA-binding CsgD family transcriptional regulator